MIGHRADGRRINIGSVIPGAAVWLVRDYEPEDHRFWEVNEPPGVYSLTVREVALRVQRIWYPDDWQGPLESDWEHLDDEWRAARAFYRADLRYERYPYDDDEIERRVQLRFPDDEEIARVEIVLCLVAALRVLGGAPRGLSGPAQYRKPLGARPEGRVETHYVEDGAPEVRSMGDVEVVRADVTRQQAAALLFTCLCAGRCCLRHVRACVCGRWCREGHDCPACGRPSWCAR